MRSQPAHEMFARGFEDRGDEGELSPTFDDDGDDADAADADEESAPFLPPPTDDSAATAAVRGDPATAALRLEKHARYAPPPRESWLHYLYGNLELDQMPQIAALSLILAVIIGGFWLLDSLKDTIIATVVGIEHIPEAKMISVGVTLVLVLGYNSLVNQLEKPTLFFVIGCALSARRRSFVCGVFGGGRRRAGEALLFGAVRRRLARICNPSTRLGGEEALAPATVALSRRVRFPRGSAADPPRRRPP